jgi:hypothetical protein
LSETLLCVTEKAFLEDYYLGICKILCSVQRSVFSVICYWKWSYFIFTSLMKQASCSRNLTAVQKTNAMWREVSWLIFYRFFTLFSKNYCYLLNYITNHISNSFNLDYKKKRMTLHGNIQSGIISHLRWRFH